MRSREQNLVNLSMLIKVPVAGTPVEVIRQYIETQGEKKVLNIAYRFRIYPTEEQKILLGKTFGCCRFLYNQMLDDKIREYEKTKKMLKNTPAMYKREYPFLKEVDSLALEMSSFIWKRHIYHCECGNKMDRDHNAAINIREEVRRMLTA